MAPSWQELADPWPDVFALMWEAYCAGTIPVGAVVVDGDGGIVSRGRNRIFDEAEHGHLARTRLAHAEINALVSLSSDRTYEDHTLYTALEPCHLCLSATFSVRIGTLRYAAADVYGGAVGKLVPGADHALHPVTVDGPLGGAAGSLAELLLVAHFLSRGGAFRVLDHYRSTKPELVARAARVPAPGDGATLADVVADLEA
jgi:tRNA(adenine34) deaminase